MDIMTFIKENMAVLVPALWIIGVFLKTTPKVPDWTIPWIIVVLGVVGSISLSGVSADSVIQGVLVSGGAVLVQNLIKQTVNKE